MKVALMQPYFFPYIGYYQLINSVDEFVIFDNAQYIRRGWINRNRILNTQKESSYINIPICKAPMETKIKDIEINNCVNWQEKIFQKLLCYKKAPYFRDVMDLINNNLETKESNLSKFNTSLLIKTCNVLGIETKITVLSEKFPEINYAHCADEWGIEVSKALNATTYINAIGGEEFYSHQKFQENDINIHFIQPNLTPYKQFHHTFIPGLSILDVLMFNNINEIKEMLRVPEFVNS